MKSNLLHWLGITLILATGLLHILTAQAEYNEAAYMGYLFAANFFGTLLAALALHRKFVWGWWLGLVIAIGSILGYAWSRTLGMPGMNVEEWFSAYGVMALSIESAFILLVFLKPWLMPDASETFTAPKWFNYFLPLSSLSFVVATGFVAHQWNVAILTDYGHHVGSLAQVCNTPLTSFTELEQEYGVQVSLAATSMMGSIVDVRIKIVDPEKAHLLLNNQAALLVNQQALILAPHMHSHNTTRLKAGKIFVVFFPTQQKIVEGSEVSLVFGSVRVQPVVVR